MQKLFQRFLAVCRLLWLAGLELLGASWRWLRRWLAPTGRTEGPRADPGRAPRASAERRAAEPTASQRSPTQARGTGKPASGGHTEPAPAPAEPVPAVPSGTVFTAGGPVSAVEPVRPAQRKAVAQPGSFTDGVFRNDAGQRDYKLYIPAAKPDGPLPLVVMLHGCKQDPDDFAAGTRMNEWADHQPMLVLYPAQTRSANPYACWNWFNRHDQQRDAGEPAIIAGMIKEVASRHAVDPRRIYAAGLSAGGAMTAILAHTHPDLLAAAGVHSGLPYAAAQNMISALGVMKRGGTARRPSRARARPAARAAGFPAGVPVIVFHGDHDKTVHPLNGEHVVEQALEPARAARPHDLGRPLVKAGRVPGGHAYTRTTYADRAGRVQVEHWVVQGSGHAWSGGDAAGSFTDPLGPDASAEMLRFFLERPKA